MSNGTVQPQQVQLNPDFVSFLQKFPDLMVKFLDIINQWYKIQQNPSLPPVSTGGGPKQFEIGGSHPLQTQEITNEFLEAITKGYATAEIKEKILAFIHGFISGVMIVSGV